MTKEEKKELKKEMRKESNKKGMKIALISLASIFLLGGGIAAGVLIPLSKAKINHTTNGGSGNWNPSLPGGGNNGSNNPSQDNITLNGQFNPNRKEIAWSNVKIETLYLHSPQAQDIYFKSYVLTQKNTETDEGYLL